MEKTVIFLEKDQVVEFHNGVILNNKMLDLLQWLQFGLPDSKERNHGIRDSLEMLHSVGDLIIDLHETGTAPAESIVDAMEILRLVCKNYEQFKVEYNQVGC